MVAHDGEDAVGSLQLAEDALEGIQLGGLHVLQVAREADDVRLLLVDGCHHFLYHPGVVAVGAKVCVAEKGYTIAVESLWQ